jgi:protein subunit release factor A
MNKKLEEAIEIIDNIVFYEHILHGLGKRYVVKELDEFKTIKRELKKLDEIKKVVDELNNYQERNQHILQATHLNNPKMVTAIQQDNYLREFILIKERALQQLNQILGEENNGN